MPILGSDIKFRLSGGTHNADPNEAIGGDISYQALIGTMNNLFDNVLEEESETGHTDYRCFYILNNHATDTLYSMLLYVYSQVVSGATVQIGSYLATEVQRLVLRGSTITGGTLTLSFDEEETGPISWGGDKDVFRVNMQSALNALDALGGISIPDVSVIETPTTTTYYLDVYFEGVDDHRGQSLLEITDQSLTGCDTAEFSRVAAGGPINTVASKLDFDTIAPNGVIFYDYDVDEPLEVGDLRAGEKVPVWVKRVTPEGASAMANDGFTLKVRGAIIA